jgi:hypothetical protein
MAGGCTFHLGGGASFHLVDLEACVLPISVGSKDCPARDEPCGSAPEVPSGPNGTPLVRALHGVSARNRASTHQGLTSSARMKPMTGAA